MQGRFAFGLLKVALCAAFICAAMPASARQVMASCWTYSDSPVQFQTTIAPITIDDVVINSGEEANLIKRAARGTMEANGLPKGKDFSCSFYRPGDRTNSPSSQSDIQYGIDHPKDGTRIVRIDGFIPAEASPRFASPTPSFSAADKYWYCQYNDGGHHYGQAVVKTALPSGELAKQWFEKVASEGWKAAGCFGKDLIDVRAPEAVGFDTAAPAEARLNSLHRYTDWTFTRFQWEPKAANVATSQRLTATVNLANADPAKNERGYLGLAFKVEYQFLVCFGELHIAYSLLEDSVRPRSDSTLEPAYALSGKFHSPTAAIPTKIVSVPLTGTVSTRTAKLIGTFGDNFAAKALGFGCFTGQTKKLGNMKDFLPENASEAQVTEFLNSLEATMKTTEIYQSADAEDEINRFLREHPGEETMDLASEQHHKQVTENRARAKQAAEEARKDDEAIAAQAARRRKEEIERENAERLAEYNRQMEEHRKAVEENNRQVAAAAEAQRQYEADKAEFDRKVAESQSNAEAQQEAYRQQRAAWEAELRSGKYAPAP